MKVICNQQRIQNKYLSILIFCNLVILLSFSLHKGWLGLIIGFGVTFILNLWMLKKYRKAIKNAKDYVTINFGAFHHHHKFGYYELPLFDIESFIVRAHHRRKRGLRNIKVVYNQNQSYEFDIDYNQLDQLEKVLRRPLNYDLVKNMHPLQSYMKQKRVRHYVLLQILASIIGLILTVIGIYLYHQGISPRLNLAMITLIVSYSMTHFYSFLDKREKWFIKLSYLVIGILIYVAIIGIFISTFNHFVLEIPFSYDYFIYALYALSSFTVVILIFILALTMLSYA